MRIYNLEERLISFSVLCIEITKEIQENRAGYHLSNQLVRASSSTALNYGEAQSGESIKDFIHKLKIVLKELRESLVCLKIIQKAKLTENDHNTDNAMKEANELISIFVKSISTSEVRARKGRKMKDE